MTVSRQQVRAATLAAARADVSARYRNYNPISRTWCWSGDMTRRAARKIARKMAKQARHD